MKDPIQSRNLTTSKALTAQLAQAKINLTISNSYWLVSMTKNQQCFVNNKADEQQIKANHGLILPLAHTTTHHSNNHLLRSYVEQPNAQQIKFYRVHNQVQTTWQNQQKLHLSMSDECVNKTLTINAITASKRNNNK